jgi:RAB protein geranylgeranyltransferase component A
MSFAFQRRRGTTAQHASFTGLNAELTVDTDKKTVVVHDGSTAGGTPLAKERNPLNAQSGTTYTLAATDKDAVVTASNASAITVTINNSVFAAGDRITVVQTGAGQVTFAQGTGVTIVSTGATASAPKLRAQYSAATVIAQSASSFIIVGDIA